MTTVLEQIARRLGRKPLQEHRLAEHFDGLKASAEPSVLPDQEPDALAVFCENVEKNLFELRRAPHLGALMPDLPKDLPLCLSPQPEVSGIHWPHADLRKHPRDPVLGVVKAIAGVAETGSVAIRSTDAPSSLLFLAEELLVLVDKEDIVPFQEDLWQRLPVQSLRAVHLICFYR